MTTIVNTPSQAPESNNSLVTTVVILLVIVLLAVFFGGPLLRRVTTPTQVNIPSKVDVNVNSGGQAPSP